MAELTVYYESRIVGTIVVQSDGPSFTYGPEWLSMRGAFPISLLMPLSPGRVPARLFLPWAANLLPESTQLRAIGLQLGAAPEDVIGSVSRGLYVTELIGFGVNFVTGDYSRGAVGFWIEDGELAYPVEEITIAGNLSRMLGDVEMIGRDLVFRDQTASPTLKIARMTIAGQ